ncbi:hypothetical protein GCM10023214_45750 [Amycolatopsis dongchuanensis]|uniref:Uncharacterized protein n=1 Tax=Amycolatopsis dongchuanensis TaxID=1070866 RepID=A0ABP9QY81_9PSEU
MNNDGDSRTEVLTGRESDGGTWRVLAWQERDDDLMTTLHYERGSARSAGGFGGPALHGADAVNYAYGTSTNCPPNVVARTAPGVTSVIAVLASGREVPLCISPVVARFGLRFAAAILPVNDPLAGMRAVSENGTEWSTENRVPLPDTVGGSGHGWQSGGASAL